MVTQKQPNIVVSNQSFTQVEHPHRHFHADIIKRAGQNILIDHFTSLPATTLIPSEKAEDLKSGIIALITPI